MDCWCCWRNDERGQSTGVTEACEDGRGCGKSNGMAPQLGERERANRLALKRQAIASARRLVTPRSLTPPAQSWASSIGRGVAWLLPWTEDSYPGVKRGVVEMLAGRASWPAAKRWRDGSRNAPEWFATQLADMIEGRCRAGLEIVRELRDYHVPARRNAGALAVHADGRDRRGGRIGRTREPNERQTGSKTQMGQEETAPRQPLPPPGDFD